MRVTSDLWVSVLIRRVFNDGGFAAIAKRGATEAGAIFLIARARDGTSQLFGPAAQTDYEEGRPLERRFGLLVEAQDDAIVSDRLDKEKRFDPDLWIVEVETSDEQLSELVEITIP